MAKYSFTGEAVQRISRVVHAFEKVKDDSYEYQQPIPADAKVRIAKTAGPVWAKGTVKWLVPYEMKDPAGGVLPVITPGSKRLLALNLFGEVPSGKWVVCAPSEAGFYVVIAAEC